MLSTLDQSGSSRARPGNSGRPRVLVIGGGIVGLATAKALIESDFGLEVTVLEKEPAVGRHQSTHNSGVLHAGVAYDPGSEKARLVRHGIRLITQFCEVNGIPVQICGKLVLASDESQLPGLRALYERCELNSLQGLRLLAPEAAREIEPHAHCVQALHIPEEGIVDFGEVCRALARCLQAEGVEVRTGEEATSILSRSPGWVVRTAAAELEASFLINCAGLQVDRVMGMTGQTPPCRIVPFRGEYCRLRPERSSLVRGLIYPLPEKGFPFLGAHFTRRITGEVDAGPNAVLAAAREGYGKGEFVLRDLADTITFPGLWRFAHRHRRMVATELSESFSKKRYLRRLQRLVPEVEQADLVQGPTGVRAQAMLPTGELVQDFLLVESKGAVHALNVPSPAATASFAIGQELAMRALRQLSPNREPRSHTLEAR